MERRRRSRREAEVEPPALPFPEEFQPRLPIALACSLCLQTCSLRCVCCAAGSLIVNNQSCGNFFASTLLVTHSARGVVGAFDGPVRDLPQASGTRSEESRGGKRGGRGGAPVRVCPGTGVRALRLDACGVLTHGGRDDRRGVVRVCGVRTVEAIHHGDPRRGMADLSAVRGHHRRLRHPARAVPASKEARDPRSPTSRGRSGFSNSARETGD